MHVVNAIFFIGLLFSVAQPMNGDHEPSQEGEIETINNWGCNDFLPEELNVTIFAALGPLAIYEIWWHRVVCKSWYKVISKNSKKFCQLFKIKPVHWAAAFGDVGKIIELKLDHKFFLSEPLESGLRPVHFAITYSHHDFIKILKIAGALQTKSQTLRILRNYASSADEKTKGLLAPRPMINYAPEILIEAIQTNNYEHVFKILYQDQAIITRGEVDYLQQAKLLQDQNIYRLLLFAHQTFYEKITFDGLQKIGYIPQDTFDTFVQASLNAYNKDGFTLLHLCAKEPLFFDVLEDLLEYKDIQLTLPVLGNLEDTQGMAALHLAAAYGAFACLQALLETELIDINILAGGEYQGTALHYALFYDQYDCFDYLIEQGASLESLDAFGNTILHWVAADGNLEAVKKLCLNYKIDRTVRNKMNMSACDMAQDNGYFGVVDFLLSLKD